VNGFAKTGTTIAKATNSAAMRETEWIFMRITYSLSLSISNEP
jgi:hypothetical protein